MGPKRIKGVSHICVLHILHVSSLLICPVTGALRMLRETAVQRYQMSHTQDHTLSWDVKGTESPLRSALCTTHFIMPDTTSTLQMRKCGSERWSEWPKVTQSAGGRAGA